MTLDLNKLKGIAAFIDQGINYNQSSPDMHPEPATQWDHEACIVVGEIRAMIAEAERETTATPEEKTYAHSVVGKLIDQMSQLEMLWGLDEPGALVRFADVSNVLFAVSKAVQANEAERASPAHAVVTEDEQSKFEKWHRKNAHSYPYARSAWMARASMSHKLAPQPIGVVVPCEDYGSTIKWQAPGMPKIGTKLYSAPLVAQAPVAEVDDSDDGMFARILPDVAVKVGDKLYAHPSPDLQAGQDARDAALEEAAQVGMMKATNGIEVSAAIRALKSSKEAS